MSRDAKITLEWGDGEHDFRLAIGQLIELEETLDECAQFMLEELLNLRGRVKWQREILRIGLIGGGLRPIDATKLVKKFFDEVPPLHQESEGKSNFATAARVLNAGLRGAAGEDLPKPQATAEAEKSSLPSPSTEPAPQ